MAPRRSAAPRFTPLPPSDGRFSRGGELPRNAGIWAASREAERAAHRADLRRAADAERRRPIVAIDRALSLLEESLATGEASPETLHSAQRIAEAATGRRVPQALMEAGCALELHEVLLDWQGDFLADAALVHGAVPGASRSCQIEADAAAAFLLNGRRFAPAIAGVMNCAEAGSAIAARTVDRVLADGKGR